MSAKCGRKKRPQNGPTLPQVDLRATPTRPERASCLGSVGAARDVVGTSRDRSSSHEIGTGVAGGRSAQATPLPRRRGFQRRAPPPPRPTRWTSAARRTMRRRAPATPPPVRAPEVAMAAGRAVRAPAGRSMRCSCLGARRGTASAVVRRLCAPWSRIKCVVVEQPLCQCCSDHGQVLYQRSCSAVAVHDQRSTIAAPVQYQLNSSAVPARYQRSANAVPS